MPQRASADCATQRRPDPLGSEVSVLSHERDNPYAPPSADLHVEDSISPRRLGWKIYFWFLMAGFGLVIPTILFLGTLQPLDLIDCTVSAVGMVGLFGYAYGRAIGRRRFWAVWFPILIAWDALVSLFFVPRGLAYAFPGSEPTTMIEDLFSLVVAVPLYVALFLYSFKSHELWSGRLVG